MSILVTRPEPGASRTLAVLAQHGLIGIPAPLFDIAMTDAPRPTGKFAALIVTSANGAAGLAPAFADLAADIPVFAVGDRTADAMVEAGFTQVSSASGDSKALAKLVSASVAPRYRLLLVTGEDHKDALPAALTAAGYEAATWTRYKAVALAELPESIKARLRDGGITSALHYSRRAAETFVALAGSAGLAGEIAKLAHHALSDDVAQPLAAAGCSNIRIASAPTEERLLATLLGDGREGDASPAPAPPASGSAETPSPDTHSQENPSPDSPNLETGGAGQAANPTVIRSVPRSRRTRPGAVLAPAPSAASAPEPSSLQPVREDSTAAAGDADAKDADRKDHESHDPIPKDPEPVRIESTPSTPRPVAEAAELPNRRGSRSGSGIGWAGLTGLALAGGLAGAAAVIFFAPVLNSFGVRLPNSPTLASVDARLSQLEGARTHSSGPAAADPALRADIDAAAALAAQLRQQAEAADRRIAELAARPAPSQAAGPAPEAMARLQQQAERSGSLAEEASAAAKALAARLPELERSARAASAPSLAATGAARLIMADRIAQALAEGRPFAQEAAALAAMNTPPEPLSLLTAASQAGVPTTESLRAALAAVRRQAVSSPAADASWTDRLVAMLDSVIRIRVNDPGQRQSPLAIVNRIDLSLQQGDVVAAVELFGQLPEPTRRAGADWLEAATRRASADTALKTITDDAIRAISGAQ